jgi:hypothetical protein
VIAEHRRSRRELQDEIVAQAIACESCLARAADPEWEEQRDELLRIAASRADTAFGWALLHSMARNERRATSHSRR